MFSFGLPKATGTPIGLVPFNSDSFLSRFLEDTENRLLILCFVQLNFLWLLKDVRSETISRDRFVIEYPRVFTELKARLDVYGNSLVSQRWHESNQKLSAIDERLAWPEVLLA